MKSATTEPCEGESYRACSVPRRWDQFIGCSTFVDSQFAGVDGVFGMSMKTRFTMDLVPVATPRDWNSPGSIATASLNPS